MLGDGEGEGDVAVGRDEGRLAGRVVGVIGGAGDGGREGCGRGSIVVSNGIVLYMDVT